MKPKKPQSSQRKILCTKNEYPHKDITRDIISCGIEVHSKLGPGLLVSIYEEALAFEFELRKITYLRAMDKRVGLLLNFNVERLKDGNTINHLRVHRGDREFRPCNLNNINDFSVCSVVNF